jgi:hypothetical protein
LAIHNTNNLLYNFLSFLKVRGKGYFDDHLHRKYVYVAENLLGGNDLGYILLQTENAFALLEKLDY